MAAVVSVFRWFEPNRALRHNAEAAGDASVPALPPCSWSAMSQAPQPPRLASAEDRDLLLDKARHPHIHRIGASLLPARAPLRDASALRDRVGRGGAARWGVAGLAPGSAAAVCLALACAAVPAAAEERPLWEWGLGAGLLQLPHYRGADQARTWLLPLPYAVYRGQVLRADREGARAVLLEAARFDFDLSLSAGLPARSGDNRARQGMADLQPTLEFGPKLNLQLDRGAGWSLALRVPVRAVFSIGSGSRLLGASAEPHLNLALRLGPALQGWNLGLQFGALWAERGVHGYVYDVAPGEATASRPAYRARGGHSGWQATLGLSRRHGDLWHGAFVRADGLSGARFAASPLVRRRHAVAFGYAVSWVLHSSTEMVNVAD